MEAPMGLDMYLTASKCFYRGTPEEKAIKRRISKVIGTDLDVKAVEFRLAYWRKANQVHAWFVEQVQGGKDDCGT